MALSSSSTVSDALDQMADNLRWRGDSSKCVLFLEAIEFLIIKQPASMAFANRSLTQRDLKDMREEVSTHLDAIGGSSRRTSFVQARPL